MGRINLQTDYPIRHVGDFLKNGLCLKYKREYRRMSLNDATEFKQYIYRLPITEYYKDIIWEYLNDDEDSSILINKWMIAPKHASLYTTDDSLKTLSELRGV